MKIEEVVQERTGMQKQERVTENQEEQQYNGNGGNIRTNQGNQSLYYKKSQKITSRMFREIFDFEENDRNKKDLKRDYRSLESNHRVVKFKHLIDFYLSSSEDFGLSLKAVDARKVLDSLALQLTDSELEEQDHQQQRQSEEDEEDTISHFNEKMVRVICLNQAIDKYQRELQILTNERDLTVEQLMSRTYSEKLQVLLQSVQGCNIQQDGEQEASPNFNMEQLENARGSKMQYSCSSQSVNNGNGASQSTLGQQPNVELDKNLQQIDIKLQNMMQFMNDFAVNFQTNIRDQAAASQSHFRPSSASYASHLRPSSSSYRAANQGLLTTQVWPKSRMLFAVVSKMSKEGLLNEVQRGVLKDLILDYDQRLLQCLQEYETGGDRERLYFNFLNLANQHV